MRGATGVGARAAACRQQAILVLRWFREDADMKILAADTQVSTATDDRYLHEGIECSPPKHRTGPTYPPAARPPADPRDAGRHADRHRPVPNGQPGDRPPSEY